MEFNVPDTSAASADASPATPADSTPSASVTEAPTQSVSEPTADAPLASPDAQPVGEATTPSQENEATTQTVTADEQEYPDDAAFEELPGEERASNWKQLRNAFADAKRQIAELQAAPSEAAPLDEEVQSKVSLADSLFAPLTDANGEPVLDDMGLPQYTSQPFIDTLVEQSPNTLAEILWRSFDEPVSDSETFGHWLMRERLGLDPAMLDTYQQIRNSQDAVKYISASTGIDPAELESVPEQYHAAYKSLTPELRAEVQAMGDIAREQYLAERAELLETRKFREEQQARAQQEEQARQQQWQQQVQQRGEQIIDEVRERSIKAQYDTLKQKAIFSQDESVNTAVHDEIVSYAQRKVENDSLLQNDLQRCDNLYRMAAYHEATRDEMKARAARVEADKLANKLTIKLGNFVTERTGFWSKVLGNARSNTQQQVQNASPRVELGASGSPQSQPSNPGAPQPPQGQRFGFSDGRMSQLVEAYRQSQQNQSYR